VSSEVLLQIPELLDHDQPAATGPDLLPLEHPGVEVGDKHCIQADGKRGIDVRLRAVADRPRSIGYQRTA